MDENLEVHLVDTSYEVFELIGGIVKLSPRIRTIRIWFKHGGRVRLDHVVNVQLYRGYPEVIVVVLLPSLRELAEGLWVVLGGGKSATCRRTGMSPFFSSLIYVSRSSR